MVVFTEKELDALGILEKGGAQVFQPLKHRGAKCVIIKNPSK